METKCERLDSVMKRIGFVMLIWFLFVNVLYTGSYYIHLFVTDLFPNSAKAYILTNLLTSASYFLSFVLPVPIFRALSSKSGAQVLPLSLTLPKSHSFLRTMWLIFLGIALTMMMAYFNSLFFPSNDFEEVETQEISHSYQIVLLFISGALVPAFSEEFLFRGMILTNLRPYGKGFAIVTSALLFGIMHQSFHQFLYASAVGILFGWICCETESLWCGILLHLFNNTEAFVEERLFSFLPYSGGYYAQCIMLVIILLALILSLVFFLIDRKESVGISIKECACIEEKRDEPIGVYRSLLCLPMVLFFAFCLIEMFVNLFIG